jgi:hypothetical protein
VTHATPVNGAMRIGTWNLQGRWDLRHLELLSAHDCDVWLLTEVNKTASSSPATTRSGPAR